MQCLVLYLHMASQIRVNIGSGNGFSPVQQQAITWTNAELLTILSTPYALLSSFATRFAACPGGILITFEDLCHLLDRYEIVCIEI